MRHMAVLGSSMMLTDCAAGLAAETTPAKLHVSSNSWGWSVLYRREKRDFGKSLGESLADVARSGMNGIEMGAGDPAGIDALAPLLKKHGLEMRSLYVGSTLHEPELAEKSIASVVAVAERAKAIGTRIIVTNPSPLRSRESQDKNDKQLQTQAAALDKLGEKLRVMGLVLAYHTHSVELRNAARELHHMLLATDPRNLSFCLDCHWIYRGAGNSSVALFDVLKLYGPRVVELHLRQSVDNVWSETFGPGDIDYPAVAKYLAGIGVKPLLVLEQGPEAGTPKTLDPVEIHRRSRQYVDRVFQ